MLKGTPCKKCKDICSFADISIHDELYINSFVSRELPSLLCPYGMCVIQAVYFGAFGKCFIFQHYFTPVFPTQGKEMWAFSRHDISITHMGMISFMIFVKELRKPFFKVLCSKIGSLRNAF